MSRLVLAFVCFFRILFGKQLPPAAAKLLPEGATPAPPRLAEASLPKAAPAEAKADAKAGARTEGKTEAKADAKTDARPKEPRPEPGPKVSSTQQHRDGALALLALLQREGRLVDFLREPLDGFSDADIGAAVRDVHRGCRKVLDQHLSLEPVMPGSEEARVAVPRGFDPAEIRLIGEARGEPPFHGTLRHHGWRVVDARLPALADGVDRAVIAPAEVEL